MRHWTGKSLVCTAALSLLALPALADHHEGHAAAGAQQGAAQGAPEMSAEDKAMWDAYMAAGKVGPEHERLAQGVGKWKATVRMWQGPGEPQVSEATSERKTILDGRVVADHFEGNMMGMPFVGHGMTGYDNVKKMYWSTWNDSMSTGIMTMWGKWDEAQNGLVMEGDVSDPMTGGTIKVKMVSRYPEAGKEIFEMWEPRGPGGEMIRTMEITYVKQ